MKKIVLLLLCMSALFSCFSCQRQPAVALTCQEVISAYENAGYTVTHSHRETEDDNRMICSVSIAGKDENQDDWLYIHFFADEADAEVYYEEYKRVSNPLITLFTYIFGQGGRIHVKQYGVIEYEYQEKDMVKPLQALIKSKS